ncbi:hypothetical protein [Demequina sp. SO4-18]|uniref:hypothetical protein n=1 Tax=Demequina sp. SO4-18 TaxID=3401026 RepID=UPI003B5C1F82
MPSASLPIGTLPAVAPVTLTGHRSVVRRYELLDGNGSYVADLDGVRGASLKQSAQATLKRGGNAAVTDMGQDVNWLTARIRASYEIVGGPSWGLGVYLPSMPVAQWSGGVRRWDVELLDVATVLAESTVDDDYEIVAGTVVTDAVRTLIDLAGENAAAVTDSPKTLTTSRVWEAGTPLLTIINELLDSIGYFSLATDGDGRLTGSPYVRPAARPEEWEFIDDGETCIYRPEMSVEQDLYRVPNHVLARTQGTGDNAGLLVNVYNDSPDSPFSRANRGRTITRVIDAEATDLDALETIASRALIDATTPTSTVVIDALPVPLDVNAAVRFRSQPAGIDHRHVVTNIEYGANDTDLARYTLREVVDI